MFARCYILLHFVTFWKISEMKVLQCYVCSVLHFVTFWKINEMKVLQCYVCSADLTDGQKRAQATEPTAKRALGTLTFYTKSDVPNNSIRI